MQLYALKAAIPIKMHLQEASCLGPHIIRSPKSRQSTHRVALISTSYKAVHGKQSNGLLAETFRLWQLCIGLNDEVIDGAAQHSWMRHSGADGEGFTEFDMHCSLVLGTHISKQYGSWQNWGFTSFLCRTAFHFSELFRCSCQIWCRYRPQTAWCGIWGGRLCRASFLSVLIALFPGSYVSSAAWSSLLKACDPRNQVACLYATKPRASLHACSESRHWCIFQGYED